MDREEHMLHKVMGSEKNVDSGKLYNDLLSLNISRWLNDELMKTRDAGINFLLSTLVIELIFGIHY